MMIEIYGSESCGKCKIIKKKLEFKNIPHNYSMEQSEVLEVATKFNIRELPICIIDNEYYSFSKMAQWINNYDG